MDLFNKFNPTSGHDSILQEAAQTIQQEGESTSLADLILEKIAAHEASHEGQPIIQGGGMPEDAVELPAKVVEVYTKYARPDSTTEASSLTRPTSGLDFSSLATNPANYRNHSKSSQPSPPGPTSSPLRAQNHGPPTPVTKRPASSSPPLLAPYRNFSKRSSSTACGKISTLPRNSTSISTNR